MIKNVSTGALLLLLFGYFTLTLPSCKEDKLCEDATLISMHTGTDSHNAGQNCLNCHSPGGEGKGCYEVGGTVYKEDFSNIYANAVIGLYSEVNGGGILVATLEGDAKGNFYTTETINFGNGLYPSVTSSTGTTKHMGTPIQAGACNSCHGVTTAKLWAEE